VRNNTLRTVTVIGPGPGSDKTTLARHEGVYIYVPNDRSGVARMRVVSEGKTLGCFTVPYRKGEKRMTVLVTGAKPCSS
jgi:hypothetical protein